MPYDPKCLELAEYFLPTGASERHKNSMAQDIQDAVEDRLEEIADELKEGKPA